MTEQFTRFDTADYLKSPEDMVGQKWPTSFFATWSMPP